MHSLAQNAAIEEASSFDPSGVYRFTEQEDKFVIDDTTPTAKFSQGNDAGQKSNLEEISAPLSFVSANIMAPKAEVSKFEILESDVLQLQNLFPGISSLDIRHALIDTNGVVATALDTLLSLQYLQSTSHQTASSNGPLGADDSSIQSVGKASDTYGYDKRNMASENSVSDTTGLKSELIIASHITWCTNGELSLSQLQQLLPT